MADNTANIRVVADESGLDQITRDARRLEDQFERVDRSIDGASRSGTSFGQTMAAVAGGMMTTELAMRALAVVTDQLKRSFEDFTARNVEARESQERLQRSFENFTTRFGESVFGDGRAVEAMDSLAEAIDNIDLESIEFVRTIGLLIDGGVLLINTYNSVNDTLERFGLSIGDLGRLMPGPLQQLHIFNDTLGLIIDGGDFVYSALTNTSDGIKEIEDKVRDLDEALTSGSSGMRQLLGIGGQELFTGPVTIPEEPARRTGGGSRGDPDRDREIMKRGLASQQEAKLRALQDFAEEEKAQRVAQEQEAKDEQRRWVEEQLEAQRIAGEKQLELTRQIAERDMAIKDEFRQKELAKEAEALAIREQRAAEANRILGGAASALASMNFKEAKNRKKVAKDTAAAILRAEGAALIGKGTGNLIALNPIGALQVAGGGAMIAAANRISGGGGGGGGGAGATPRQTVQGPSQTIVNPTVSFGFVGDRRAAYRDVEEANRRAMERS